MTDIEYASKIAAEIKAMREGFGVRDNLSRAPILFAFIKRVDATPKHKASCLIALIRNFLPDKKAGYLLASLNLVKQYVRIETPDKRLEQLQTDTADAKVDVASLRRGDTRAIDELADMIVLMRKIGALDSYLALAPEKRHLPTVTKTGTIEYGDEGLLDAPWLAAGLRIKDNQTFIKEITARAGETVEAHVQIRNTTGEQTALGIGLSLAQGLTLVEDSAKLNSSRYTGEPLGGISGKTTNIGCFSPFDETRKQGWAEVVFKLRVSDNVADLGFTGKRLEILNAVYGYEADYYKIATKPSIYYTYIMISK